MIHRYEIKSNRMHYLLFLLILMPLLNFACSTCSLYKQRYSSGNCYLPNNNLYSCTSAYSNCMDDETTSGDGRCDYVSGSATKVCTCASGFEYSFYVKECRLPNTGSQSASSSSKCADQDHLDYHSSKCYCSSGLSWDSIAKRCGRPNNKQVACSSDSDCIDSINGGCISGKCDCDTNYAWSTDMHMCLLKNNGNAVSATSMWSCVDNSLRCLYDTNPCTCRCQSGCQWSESQVQCICENQNNHQCDSTTDCYDQSTVAAVCSSSKCACQTGYTYDSTRQRCKAPNDGNYGCDDINHCVDNNSGRAECNAAKICVCLTDYVWRSSSSLCMAKNNQHVTVGALTSCADQRSGAAALVGGTCGCATDFFWYDSTSTSRLSNCVTYNDNDATAYCSGIGYCYDQTSYSTACTANKCTCALNYQWMGSPIYSCVTYNNGANTCDTIIQCYDQSSLTAECSTSLKCDCKTNYHYNPTTHKCGAYSSAYNTAGITCNTRDQCYDPNTLTTSCSVTYGCMCNNNYYWKSASLACLGKLYDIFYYKFFLL